MYLLIGLLVLMTLSDAVPCKRLDDCRCELDSDGGVVNLWPLGHQDFTPLFEDFVGKDGHRYSYNPCYPFDQGSCLSSGICKSARVESENLANNTISFFDWDGRNVLATYIARDNFTVLVVTLECDPSRTVPTFQAYGKQSGPGIPGLYNFKVTSQCACGNGCVGNDMD